MKDEKRIQIEPDVKAPDSIRKGVQSTLSAYRMMGDVASLYLNDLSQTLIGFTELVSPIHPLPPAIENNGPVPPKKDLP
jgi:hypothetical protein